MLIGAQLYSVRNKCSSQEEIKETFAKMKEYGYESVQISGFAYNAEETAAAAKEVGIHIGLTHVDTKDIIENVDEVIAKHKALGVDMVGLGYPGPYLKPGRIVDVEKMVEDLLPYTKKIEAAGLKFGYHNHEMEFKGEVGSRPIDYIYKNTSWQFIMDTGWVYMAGANVEEEIHRFKDRLHYIHLKDFRDQRPDEDHCFNCMVAMGEGKIPYDGIVKALKEVGTVAAYVEQDNAVAEADSWLEMKKSIDFIKSQGWM